MPFEAGGMPGFQTFGMPGGGTRTFHFNMGGRSGGFNFSNPDDIFMNFAKSGGVGGEGDDLLESILGGRFGGGGFGGGGGGPFRGGGGQQSQFRSSNETRRAPTPEVTTVERNLPLSLEELFKGAHKKMRIKRKTFDERTGKRSVEDKILEMDIKPGLKAGSKIKFKGVGDQEEGGTQDLHFIVTEVRYAISTDDLCPRTA
jgi:DnaJ family protein B protein 4